MSAIAKQQRVKGDTFREEAKKTQSKKTWFASSTEQKNEEAAELYMKAANAYKVGGFGMEAGNAYESAAEIYRGSLNNIAEASNCLKQAGACFKKDDTTKAITSYRSAISLLCDSGRLTQAAKLSKEVAELFENQESEESENSIVLAIESYEQAAELFQMEQQHSQSSQCLAKVAELASAARDPPELLRAAKIYSDLGKQCLESNLLKYNAKGYFLQCIMCHLANQDSIAASQALQRFGALDFTFDDSREGKFARDLVECVDKFDVEGFATVCFEFDRITKLDPWKTAILVKVRRSIEGQTGDAGEDDIDLT
jgi:alpha-soluble NSF attachment protein